MTLFVKKNPTIQEMKETKGKVKVTKKIIRKPVPQWEEAEDEEESIARGTKSMLMGKESVVQRHFQTSFFSSSRPSKPLPLQLSDSSYYKVEKELSSTTLPSPSSSKSTQDGKTISKKRTFGGSKKVMADLRRQFEEQSPFRNNNNQDSPDSLNSVKSYFSSDSDYGSDASSCSSWGDGPELELLTFGDDVKGKWNEIEGNEREKTIDP